MIGKTVSHYRILEKLGGGGMGVVYKAEDTKLKRTVALKFLPAAFSFDEDAKKRFINEAQAASSLQHNNICNIHDIDETKDGQIFICMDCYEGETLKKKIERGPLKINDAIEITIQIAAGLQKAHEKGITHRDVKPANIFITNDGIIKILDFGLAKLSGQTIMTKMGSTLGTVSYMSPEQAQGEIVDHRTDIWSLGVVLYEMLTGLLPFKGDYEQAILYSVLSEEPNPITSLRTGIPIELERIVCKSMAKKPEERFQHIDEMIVDLKKLLKDSESITIEKQKPAVGREKSFYKKHKIYLISAAVLLIAAITFLLLKQLLPEDVFISEPTPIAVFSFENQTGDASFDYLQKAIPNLLITNLEQSKYFRVTTWERMQDLLNQMGKVEVKVIDKDLGFDLCKRDGVDIIVIGSYIKAGNMFATDIKILDVATKQIIKSVSSRGEGIGSILEFQIDDLSNEISQSIGISFSKIAAEKLRVIDVTTNSMEAYNYYLKGRDYYDRFYPIEARDNFEKAIEIDSTFATAHLYLSDAYSSLQETKKRNDALEKAYHYSEKATEKEKLIIEATFASVIERAGEKRLRILKELANKYPKEKLAFYELGVYYRDNRNNYEAKVELNKALILDPKYSPALNLIAYVYANLGDYKKAIESLQKYSELNPNDANPFDSMADYYWMIGQPELATEYYLKALEIKPDFSQTAAKMAYISAEKENYEDSERWINKAIGTAPSDGIKVVYVWIRAFFKSWQGKFNQAVKDLNTARELSQTIENKYIIAGSNWLQAYICYDTDELDLVNQYYLRWIDYRKKYSPADYNNTLGEHKFLMAFVNIKKNLLDSAKIKLTELKSQPKDLISNRRSYRINLLDAEISLAEKSPAKAIVTLKNAEPQNVPILAYPEIVTYNTPYLKDILARSYQQAGQLDKAISEYERLITYNPKDKERYLIHPRYHYRLAVLYEEKGLKDKAVKEFKRFLELWKNADENLPEPIDANKRLNKLIGLNKL